MTEEQIYGATELNLQAKACNEQPLDRYSVLGRLCVVLGKFKSKQKVEKLIKFCQDDIVRFLSLMIDKVLATFAKEVPCFADWEKTDGVMDFCGDINAQLCALAKLVKTETAYVVSTIHHPQPRQFSKAQVSGELMIKPME